MREVSLEDRYTATSGRILISGVQALVRLPLMQRARDVANGLDTAGYISGYRGSPLGVYDSELQRASAHLSRAGVRFNPGVNEDLAATAIWGSQQAHLLQPKQDGVFAIWYGKGPGVDRSLDALKHANLAGVSPHGGVLAAFGDDHGAKSSTLAYQSEPTLIAASIPILAPANVADVLEYGLLGWAMSRYSGLWVGLKCTSEVIESTASIDLDALEALQILIPDSSDAPVHVHTRYEPLDDERRQLRMMLPRAIAFARANNVDKRTLGDGAAPFRIAASGKAYADVAQALALLGIDDAGARDLGLSLWKIGLSWPLDADSFGACAAGAEEVLVVEEKRPIIEDQAAKHLYRAGGNGRPRLIGKTDETGAPLLPTDGVLDPRLIADVIASRLERRGKSPPRRLANIAKPQSGSAPLDRVPYFCSGCPHNTSTKTPDGSLAMAGIGCSYMAVWMDRNTLTSTQMGGEGANWIGASAFSRVPHMFQNMGDGTYFHSGLLAVRAAVAANVSMTYKILYNDAVAMTGGQRVDGPLSVDTIARQVAAEGVALIVVVTDEPEKYARPGSLMPGVRVHHRRELDAVQRRLRQKPGVSVLIYDQGCAAEKRRKRKRGELADPARRVYINEDVCEGCGDCSVKSNCVSVLPVETEFGRRRAIDQSACNKDFSCVEGFCPSFVTVRGGKLKAPAADAFVLSAPPPPVHTEASARANIVIAGIGGTGVVTVGAVLTMAAHLEGKSVVSVDMAGLAQKNGAVLAHIQIGGAEEALVGRVAPGACDVLLGCDLVAACSADVLAAVNPGVTRAIVNADVAPTGAFQADGDMSFEPAPFERVLSDYGAEVQALNATALASRVIGDALATNFILLGYAYQLGRLPVSETALFKAIELNRAGAAANKRAFAVGRAAAHDPAACERLLAKSAAPSRAEQSLQEIVDRRADWLAAYQDARYAGEYRSFIASIAARESGAVGGDALAKAAAKALFKLMAYKDEYEVARLYSDGTFKRRMAETFASYDTLEFHLAPPLLSSLALQGGHPRKWTFGPWMLGLFGVLARLKGLRGTPLDVFGYSEERRRERALIGEYRAVVDELAAGLRRRTLPVALRIAELPNQVRGYGHVKAGNMARMEASLARLMAQYRAGEATDERLGEASEQVVHES
ncbi:MAG: indolepyruvate ferredoxin oxidoreductase family protein [Hyphomonadaceae bacterium]|nr:indolepyruvate ferredoxin oxidoreductase family protein [Hyphomonadaceae bacterium]